MQFFMIDHKIHDLSAKIKIFNEDIAYKKTDVTSLSNDFLSVKRPVLELILHICDP